MTHFQRGPDLLYRNDGPVGPGGAHAFTDVALEAGTVRPGEVSKASTSSSAPG